MSTPPPTPTDPLDREAVKQRAVAGIVTFVMRGVILRLLGVASTVVLARVLVPAELGVVAIGQSILAVGFLIAGGGLASGLIQQSESPTRRQLRTAFGSQLAICVPLLALLGVLAALFGRTWQIAGVMALAIPLSALRVPTAIVAQRELNYTPLAQNKVLEALISQVLMIVFVLAGFGVWGIALALLPAPLIGSVVLNTRLEPGWVRPGLEWSVLRPMLRFGSQFQAIHIFNVTHKFGMNFVIGAVGGIAVLGVWNIVTRLLALVSIVLDALYSITFSAMARILDAGVSPVRLLSRGLGMTAIAIGLVCVGLGAPAAAYVPVLLGERWVDAGDAFTLVTITLMVNAPISTCLIGYLLATDRAREVLLCVVPSGVISLGLTAALVPGLGVLGAVIPAFLWTVIECFLLVRAARRTVSFPAYGILVPPLVASTVCIAAGWLAVQELGASLPVAIGVGILAEAAFLTYAVLWRRDDLVQLVSRLAQGLPRPASQVLARFAPAVAR